MAGRSAGSHAPSKERCAGHRPVRSSLGAGHPDRPIITRQARQDHPADRGHGHGNPELVDRSFEERGAPVGRPNDHPPTPERILRNELMTARGRAGL